MRVDLRTPVRFTEDEAKVRDAVQALFPGADLARTADGWEGSSGDLRPLRRRVWELRIIDATRGQLLRGLAADGRSLTVRFSKQAALAGRVSFPPTPHALGDIEATLRVEADDPWPDAERLAWWLAPETREGEIVGPVEP